MKYNARLLFVRLLNNFWLNGALRYANTPYQLTIVNKFSTSLGSGTTLI